MKKLSLFFFASLILLSACSDDSESTKPVAGYFKLVQIQSSTNGRVMRTSEESTTFDLGDLKASKEFYFLLQSAGGTITDITLESDNPDFTVTPGSISELSEDGSIIPLISVGIIHGVQLNGFGFTNVLDMGENSMTLTIRGKTKVEGTLVDVESSFVFTVSAKLMDIRLFDGEQELDLAASDVTASGVPDAGGIGAVNGYIAQSGDIKIQNTGNVDIEVSVKSHLDFITFHTAVIQPGESTTFNITGKSFSKVKLDGHGTITNSDRLQIGSDGKAHLFVEKYDE